MNQKTAAKAKKVILITGGAQRIGAHLCNFFHEKNYNIVLHYRQSEKQAQQICQSLNTKRVHSAIALQADFSSDQCNYDALVQRAVNEWNRLDVLYNNASSFYQTPLEDLNQDDWSTLINSNFKAPAFLAKAAAPHLKASHGCIINMLDIHIERSIKNFSLYCAAKSALASLNKSLALDLAPEVRVNGISPGNILWSALDDFGDSVKQQKIDTIPLQRQGTPQDIAQTAWFLIENAPYLTGQNIAVDGGKSLI